MTVVDGNDKLKINQQGELLLIYRLPFKEGIAGWAYFNKMGKISKLTKMIIFLVLYLSLSTS